MAETTDSTTTTAGESGYPMLYGAAFAADPRAAYARLRAAGPVATAEIAPNVRALVVTSYRAALTVLKDERNFSKDPRRWRDLAEGRVPEDSPILAFMAYRPSLQYADGADHTRLRRAMDDCLARVDPHDLREVTRRATLTAINEVAPAGHADLMTALADVVPLMVVTELMGCPADLAERMVAGCRGMISAGPGAEQAAADFAACLMELVQLKRERPGRDVTSWMLAHPARLDVEEIVHQLVVLVGPGTIPMASWIAYSLWLLLTDDASVGDLAQGTITVRRALEKALWEYAPMANFSVHYARVPTVVEGVEIPAGVPVVISHAAANTDPSLPADLGYSSRAHLAFSAGPHRCPAVGLATIIATTTIETVMDRLWDMQLASPGEQPVNRHGPFHQCPVSMHVRFPPKTATAHAASHPGGAP